MMPTQSASKARSTPLPAPRSQPTDSLAKTLKNRQTQELVIGFCGAVGSGTSHVAGLLRKQLETWGYTVTSIKLSDYIKKFMTKSDRTTDLILLKKSEKIKQLQHYGNEIREQYSTDVLAQIAITNIGIERKIRRKDGEIATRRHATIIDSLKHPAEYELFRTVYGDMFYLFGVLCTEKIRSDRLQSEPNVSLSDAYEIIDRDKEEGISHGQKLIKTIHRSDVFIRNENQNDEQLEKSLSRFVKLLLGDNTSTTPYIDEYAMFIAHASGLRSGCMSRQVGSCIISKDGDIISTGRNDVPKYGGNLYIEDDEDCDNRCFSLSGGKCKSDEYRDRIIQDIKKIIDDNLPIKTESIESKIISKIFNDIESNPRLKGLIEFSRAVHAEMDAITTAARNPNISLVGATLYCTTFPCHNCARHILASGIAKVLYIEPYEKSLAKELHGDAIAVEAEVAGENKLLITPFEGVAPKRYLHLFAAEGRKMDGKRKDLDLRTEKPAIQKFIETFEVFEARVADIIQAAGLVEKDAD